MCSSVGRGVTLCRESSLHLAMPKYYETAEHVIAASIALPIVDILAVALKFRIRRIQKHPWKADDWCLVPATVRRFSGLTSSVHCLTSRRRTD